MILLIDNFDSFTFNLAQAFWGLGAEVEVRRPDQIDLAGVDAAPPDAVVISPGPGRPECAEVSLEIVRRLRGRVPLLGVCLGHQALVTALGGRVVRAQRVMHGKTSRIRHDGQGLFRGVPTPMEVGRYHSLAVERGSLPPGLAIVASSEDDDEVMAVRHRSWRAHGIQFHPESILTPYGVTLLRNFLEDLCR